jgi:hypothetical protein
MSPSSQAEAVGLEPTTVFTAPVFKTGPSSGRVTSKSCGGRNRTCVWAINSRHPVPAQDPPHHISQRGRIRTDGLVRPRHAPLFNLDRGQPFPHAEVKSAQSDLNRPNCPGRAVRYRCVMGAKFWPDCQRSRSSKWDRTDSTRHQPG